MDPRSKDVANKLSSYRDQRFENGAMTCKKPDIFACSGPALDLKVANSDGAKLQPYVELGSLKEQEYLLQQSTTLYVGNLSYYTTEEQIYELFMRAGDVRRVIMGVDRYYTREDAENGIRYINGTRLDDRVIRTDWDAGFIEGRQYGRGKHGGQVRDEFRTDFDPGRGGWNKAMSLRK